MTLSFSTEINGKPNWFVERIWLCLWQQNNKEFLYNLSNYETEYSDLRPIQFLPEENIHFHNPKLHTIRRDSHNRWISGMNIHPVINNRTPNRFQFAPVIKCTSVQTIEIKHNSGKPSVYVDGKDIYEWDCEIENGYPALQKLAINDGFDSVGDFFAYFNKDFTGKIIHWTDLKY